MSKTTVQLLTILIIAVAIGIVSSLMITPMAPAQTPTYVPEATRGINVLERLGQQIPLDLTFTDDAGRSTTLRKYFETTDRPVILQLGYYGCPKLCGEISQGIADALKLLPDGNEFKYTMLYVSIDPLEKPDLASQKKATYSAAVGKPGIAAHWHFMVGHEDQIKSLASAVGYVYKYDKQSKQYAHPAVLMLITPQGRVARYLYGTKFDENNAETLRLSLVEASGNKMGSTRDKIVLSTCYSYDGAAGKYVPVARRIMMIGGVLTVAAVATTLLWLFAGESQRRLAQAEKQNPADKPASDS